MRLITKPLYTVLANIENSFLYDLANACALSSSSARSCLVSDKYLDFLTASVYKVQAFNIFTISL